MSRAQRFPNVKETPAESASVGLGAGSGSGLGLPLAPPAPRPSGPPSCTCSLELLRAFSTASSAQDVCSFTRPPCTSLRCPVPLRAPFPEPLPCAQAWSRAGPDTWGSLSPSLRVSLAPANRVMTVPPSPRRLLDPPSAMMRSASFLTCCAHPRFPTSTAHLRPAWAWPQPWAVPKPLQWLCSVGLQTFLNQLLPENSKMGSGSVK